MFSQDTEIKAFWGCFYPWATSLLNYSLSVVSKRGQLSRVMDSNPVHFPFQRLLFSPQHPGTELLLVGRALQSSNINDDVSIIK